MSVEPCTWWDASSTKPFNRGYIVINPQYDNAWDFKNGFAMVTVGKGDDAKTGYVDKTGKIIWQPSN